MPKQKRRWKYVAERWEGILYGPESNGSTCPNSKLFDMGKKLQAQATYLLEPPPDCVDCCSLVVKEINGVCNNSISGHGGVLTATGTCLVLRSQDAPFVVIEHQRTGHLAAATANLDLVVGKNITCGPQNIISALLNTLGVTRSSDFRVWIVAGIATTECPQNVRQMIHGILTDTWRIPEKQVNFDQRCVAATPGLASAVANKPGENMLFIIKK